MGLCIPLLLPCVPTTTSIKLHSRACCPDSFPVAGHSAQWPRRPQSQASHREAQHGVWVDDRRSDAETPRPRLEQESSKCKHQPMIRHWWSNCWCRLVLSYTRIHPPRKGALVSYGICKRWKHQPYLPATDRKHMYIFSRLVCWHVDKRRYKNIYIYTSSARTSRGRKFPKGKELYSKERICL